ncbi:hypothetical protein MRB53_016372 [Persea americana]|uniref:Uncharacterized protein n=1 Tax=Persea americana TaxID=3435 RepID=A0ACC2M2M8_PERAE|nr:hypothetical protein MRB53_016372 [Persea americana]
MGTRIGGGPAWFRSQTARDGEGTYCCGWRCCYGREEELRSGFHGVAAACVWRKKLGRVQVCARVLRREMVGWVEDDGGRWVLGALFFFIEEDGSGGLLGRRWSLEEMGYDGPTNLEFALEVCEMGCDGDGGGRWKKGVSGVEMGRADELFAGAWMRLREIWRFCLGWIENGLGSACVEEDDERE